MPWWLVVENHAGSPAYWSMIVVLLLVWLASLVGILMVMSAIWPG